MNLSQWINKQSIQSEAAGQRFDRTYDVVVVGLGTAGAIAAIAAGQLGLDVLGIEQQNSMGGTGTNGLVANYYFGSKGGLFEQLDEQAKQIEREGYMLYGVNVEAKKLALEQAALQAGVAIHYESVVTGVYTDQRKVAGIRWIGQGGILEAGCRILIDCSGDASTVARAGCPTRFGRDSDGTTHAFSSAISFITNGRLKSFYTDSGYVDHTDAADLSKELIRSATLPTHLKETYHDDVRLLKVAPQLGVREGRFIVGEETVTFDQFVRDKGTNKPLFHAYANLDNHAKDFALESDLQQEWTVVCSLWSMKMAVPIPLGALIPLGLDNALVAGRSLAVDHDIASCVRMKRDMHKCGEIAAKAAYLAIRHDTTVRDVSYDRLLEMLEQTGCGGREQSEPVWLTELSTIREGLRSDKPGIAIWSARRMETALIGELTQWCEQREDDHLRKHSALALALLGEKSAIPVLREMVSGRDDFLPKTSHMYSQLRSHAAIYLLGKLGDAGIVSELMRIMKEPPVREPEESWLSNKFIVSAEDYRFQYMSYALMALLRIGDIHAACRQEIAEFLRQVVLNDRFNTHFLLNSTPDYKLSQPMTERLQKLTAARLASW
ncbi:FAD-dependent oxidoreductase [Paenibacillus hodogayensis]|uniref:FAD-dependent oxidoreductase n=1 Tax=Paenibacillus hodogayensis TaxID=279208 RepID=A0ABV5VSK7_9BACL